MILHNLAKAVREQNYYAVVLEFLIVIAGVVIGFQITAWNEERSEAARGWENLAQIRDEIQGHRDSYQAMKNSAELRLNWIKWLINVTEQPDSVVADPVALPILLYRARYRSYLAPTRVVYEGLEGAGDMALMPTEAIVISIREHYREIASWDRIYGNDPIEIEQFSIASAGYLTGQQIEATFADEPRTTPELRDFGPEQGIALAQELAHDEFFMSWINALYDYHRGVRDVSEFRAEESQVLVAEINALLDAEK